MSCPAPEKREVRKATIVEQKLSGMYVEFADRTRAWLPYDELSYQEPYAPSQRRSLRKKYPVDVEVEVIVIDRTVGAHTEDVVSVAAAKHDPWSDPDMVPHWYATGAAKVMVVTDVSKPDHYLGYIIPGVQARMLKEDFRKALGNHAGDNFFIPREGDRLAGIVHSLERRRIVNLNMTALFHGPRRSMGQSSAIPDSDLPDSLAADPEDAIRLLEDAPGMELRQQVDRHSGVGGEDNDEITRPPFQRVFILDDQRNVANTYADLLRDSKLEVDCFCSLAEARKYWGLPEEGRDEGDHAADDQAEAALVDIDLSDDPEGSTYSGIAFAKALQQHHPYCYIFLMTGQALDRRLANEAKGLRIIDVLGKPHSRRGLLEQLGKARSTPPRDAQQIILEEIGEAGNPKERRQERREKPEKERDKRIQKSLDDLKRDLKADTAVLFSMEPETYETRVEAWAGQPLTNLDAYRHKLGRSPVFDVCLDPQQPAHWYDPDTVSPKYFGKHRYLLYCYSRPDPGCRRCDAFEDRPCKEHMYHSCLAARVRQAKPAAPGYGVFAMSDHEHAFMTGTALTRIQTAAADIEAALTRYEAVSAEERNFTFVMAGISAATVGHDLWNCLAAVSTVEEAIEALRVPVDGSPPEESGIGEVRSRLERSVNMLRSAREMARHHRDLSKEEDLQHAPSRLTDLIARGEEAAQAELERADVEVYEYSYRNGATAETRVDVRPNGVSRVFQNIFNNAAQQIRKRGSFPGKIAVVISLARYIDKGQEEREGVSIDFVDDGPGIHWVERRKLFAPTVTTRPDGSGMGLYLVNQEVAKAGGVISFSESVLGVGSCIRLWLPLAEQPQDGDS